MENESPAAGHGGMIGCEKVHVILYRTMDSPYKKSVFCCPISI